MVDTLLCSLFMEEKRGGAWRRRPWMTTKFSRRPRLREREDVSRKWHMLCWAMSITWSASHTTPRVRGVTVETVLEPIIINMRIIPHLLTDQICELDRALGIITFIPQNWLMLRNTVCWHNHSNKTHCGMRSWLRETIRLRLIGYSVSEERFHHHHHHYTGLHSVQGRQALIFFKTSSFSIVYNSETESWILVGPKVVNINELGLICDMLSIETQPTHECVIVGIFPSGLRSSQFSDAYFALFVTNFFWDSIQCISIAALTMSRLYKRIWQNIW